MAQQERPRQGPQIRAEVQIGGLRLQFDDQPGGPSRSRPVEVDLVSAPAGELAQYKDWLLDQLNRVRKEEARRKGKRPLTGKETAE